MSHLPKRIYEKMIRELTPGRARERDRKWILQTYEAMVKGLLDPASMKIAEVEPAAVFAPERSIKSAP